MLSVDTFIKVTIASRAVYREKVLKNKYYFSFFDRKMTKKSHKNYESDTYLTDDHRQTKINQMTEGCRQSGSVYIMQGVSAARHLDVD